jgi:hypothetical protein
MTFDGHSPLPGDRQDGRWPRRRVLKAAGLGLVALPALAAARTHPRRRPPPQRHSSRARLGADAFGMFETEIGRQIAVFQSARSWGQPILNDTITQLLHRTPPPRLYLSFQAFLDSQGHNVIHWADIANGLYDDVIDSWSAELMQVVAVTHAYAAFHREPEQSVGSCGSPTDFQNAYWYFRNRVEVVNAVPKLTWVVTLKDDTFHGKHGGPNTWWPASSQFGLPVDQLVGVDLFNRGACHSKAWRSFEWLAVDPYRFAQRVSRPLFIGECGCVEGDDCGGGLPHGAAKARWFEDALVYMRDTAPSLGFGPLASFCYSNDSGFRDGNYRIDSSPEALAAFKALANDPFFGKRP